MGAPGLQHRVEAGYREAGGDTGEFERRAQEGLADIFAFGGVVTAGVVAAVPEGAVGGAVIHELGREDATSAHWLTLVQQRFINDAEAVALAQIAMEIDVAAEDVR